MSTADEKRAALRSAMASNRPVVVIGAHDAMSARLVARYGFDAVWVSGLGVSTMAHAIPDLNLITMTEAVGAAIRIDRATSLPVIADCDNGFGGLSNVMRTVVEYERSGIAAICVEDNVFPKRNSLYTGEASRDLIPVEEQARRIHAAKQAQETGDFTFIARIESFIAGHGVDDACRRAEAYVAAGADAILIHSRDKSLTEIESFLERWPQIADVPLVAVPTLYPTFTAAQLHQKGFTVIILANQLMRASVKAMEATLETLAETGMPASVDGGIASVDHIFSLVNTKEAIELEDQLATG
jgi:phosphoenolpyruvate phosphomutase